MLHNDSNINLDHLLQSIGSTFAYYSKALAKSTPTTQTSSWTPPPQDWFKLNFDAAITNDLVVVAAVCRNSYGAIIGLETRVCGISSALIGEARAALLDVQLAKSLNCQCIILEGDSNNVIEGFHQVEAICNGRFQI
ncbi:hypothetical protein TorRG33x02_239700 [Trema orientale]|uniref:RNase H type-1 domain-containing protein n=1 Tax=Trema orientale TaxID=63057 RepID=A0A2P5DX40_TREOI|nr:hypothetical protein TorRG33x02_239700 [Trema orientale]